MTSLQRLNIEIELLRAVVPVSFLRRPLSSDPAESLNSTYVTSTKDFNLTND